MRISDWSSDVCSSDLTDAKNETAEQSENQLGALAKYAPMIVTMIMVVGAFVAMLVVGPVGMIRAMIMAIITMLVAGLCRDSRGDGSRFPGNRSEEHTSELQSLMRISYAVFCLKKKKQMQTIIYKL